MRKTPCILLFAALSASGAVQADTLIIERLDQEQATAAERPSRGMTMDRVSDRWGTPVTQDDAVGLPPITRWEYNDFTVYFEYRHVIHAVPK
jgi:hypothetical protein